MAKRPRQTKASVSSNGLLEALKFLSLVTVEKGAPNETHVVLGNNTAVCYNGVMAAGVLIDDSISAYPHNSTMIDALSKCGQNISITSLENNRLSIKSDKFKAIVPCLEPQAIQSTAPDDMQVEINDGLKEAFKVADILSENGQLTYNVSVLLNGPSIISTTGKIAIEYWHGLNLPIVALPKQFANVITKIDKKCKAFGMGQSSVTVYFHDNSWLKTHLYAEQWPNVTRILEGPSNPYPVLPSFWEGLQAVNSFSVDGLCYFEQNVLQSHRSANAGASFELPGLPRGPIMNAKQLLTVKPYIEVVDWFCRTDNNMPCSRFFSKNCRGVIAGRLEGNDPANPQ